MSATDNPTAKSLVIEIARYHNWNFSHRLQTMSVLVRWNKNYGMNDLLYVGPRRTILYTGTVEYRNRISWGSDNLSRHFSILQNAIDEVWKDIREKTPLR